MGAWDPSSRKNANIEKDRRGAEEHPCLPLIEQPHKELIAGRLRAR